MAAELVTASGAERSTGRPDRKPIATTPNPAARAAALAQCWLGAPPMARNKPTDEPLPLDALSR